MKLQGIILPASLAVSMPTIVPAGALEATCKLLIVIVMNLSGGAIRPLNESGAAFWNAGTAVSFRRREFRKDIFIIHNSININIARIAKPIPTLL